MRLIDADKLKHRFIEWLPKDPQESGTEVENIAVSAIMEIEEATTINNEARWKGAGMGDYVCSLCWGRGYEDYKFCPHCGAVML